MGAKRNNVSAVTLSVFAAIVLIAGVAAAIGLTAPRASEPSPFGDQSFDYFALHAAQDAKLEAVGVEQARLAAEEKSRAAERLASLTIDTPYYTIVLPDSWYGLFEYTYDDFYDLHEGERENSDGTLGTGYVTSIRMLDGDMS